MSVDEQTNPYDLTYYATGCGTPYQRSEHWLAFFGQIADAIVRELAPSSVLDAGCAMGFLVEALRERGVDAYGVDISDYAIAQVAEPIKPYCWVGSLTEPLPRRYDLIVSIETLEHLNGADVQRAIENLCAATDDILFSSTPDDYGEATHFSVQPPDAWAGLFAARGFWHDIEFDAAFVAPWAMRFRRTGEPAARAIRPLERALWALRRENRSLRESVNTLRQQSSDHSHGALQQRVTQLEAELRAQQTQSLHAEPYWQLLNQALSAASDSGQFVELHHEVRSLEAQNRELRAELEATAGSLSRVLFQQTALESRLSYKAFTAALRSIDSVMPEGSARRTAWRVVSRRIKGRRAPRATNRREEMPGWRGKQIVATEMSGIVMAARSAVSMPYQTWRRAVTPSPAEQELFRQRLAQFTYRPTISLLTPVFDPPLSALRDTIESVRAQLYDNWELCVVDGGSTNPAIRELLELYAQRDSRIKLKVLERNLGISGNTNEAATLATGEFVQIFDHDDTLEPHALFRVVEALNDDQATDVLYFDEDKLSADGTRYEEPFFKPEWSPEMLLSANYLTHCVLRRALYERVGGCASASDGAQDWDLLLRVTEQTNRLRHIPEVLYHWRKVKGSAAGSTSAKPYAYQRQLTSITEHLARTGTPGAQAEFIGRTLIRVQWPVRDERISIIIQTKDKLPLLKRCLTSLFQLTAYRDFEVILVDTGSEDKDTWAYYDTLAANDRLRIVRCTGEFNYSRANNVGAKHASGSLLLFLNNDTEVIQPTWLEEMARWAQRPGVGVVGAKLLYPSGHIQHAGVVLGLGGLAGHIFAGMDEGVSTIFGSTEWYRDYVAVTGACMLTRREAFERVSGFSEDFRIAFSDVDYCVRAADTGVRVVYTPFATLLHHESATRGALSPLQDIQTGYVRMHTQIDRGDAFFNPNLATSVSVPVLAVNDAPQRMERIRSILRQ